MAADPDQIKGLKSKNKQLKRLCKDLQKDYF